MGSSSVARAVDGEQVRAHALDDRGQHVAVGVIEQVESREDRQGARRGDWKTSTRLPVSTIRCCR